jgi:lactoylglutathione lyase
MYGLNLLVLRCTDVERARSFYECFGLSFEKHRHGEGPEHLAAEEPAGVFELYPASGTNAVDQSGLGFDVEDLAAMSAKLAERGCAPGAIADRPWGRTFVVRDADGRRVEVKQG